MSIYRGDFAEARVEVDRILEKDEFQTEDLWLRAQVRQFYSYLERKANSSRFEARP